ncbi:hypothetical protein O6H91_19G069000 [Diphasiastrum complanatum]|uniref:Uncharacterized protein n=2 Tax=Diphasiastrum complanatum TaxID=34168 RepID=A0ACC2AWB2_DIPCM|nr:hypothetical protein O6H91_19G069000 [Diphasiastrum complanatum]KAJ7521814.1 hypothetical protein O6H91_19G069000 [Diphasiastrum complanatum]
MKLQQVEEITTPMIYNKLLAIFSILGEIQIPFRFGDIFQSHYGSVALCKKGFPEGTGELHGHLYWLLKQIIARPAMRAMWLSQIVVAGTGLFRKWWQSGCKVKKRSSANLTQHSRNSSTSESYVSTASSFAPDSCDESFRKHLHVSKKGCMRLFGLFSDERHKRSSGIIKVKKSFYSKPKGLYRKRRRSYCCGLSSLNLDLEEGNLSRIRNPKKAGKVDGLILRAGKPSKGFYGGACLRNLKAWPFFLQKEEKSLLIQSENKPTLYSYDPIRLNQVDNRHSKAFPGFDKNDIETVTNEYFPGGINLTTASKPLILQLSKGNLEHAVADIDGHDSMNQILMMEGFEDHAMDQQNFSQAESILSLASEKPISASSSTSSPVDLLAELSLGKEGVLRDKAGSVTKIEVAAEGRESVNHLNLITETCTSKDPKEIETAEEPAKLPKLMSDESGSCATQNHRMISEDFLKTAEVTCQNSSEQTLAGPELLDSTDFRSKTHFYSVFNVTTEKKSLDYRKGGEESRISNTTFVNKTFHLERKRKLDVLLNPSPLQVKSLRREEVWGDHAKLEDRTHSDILYTENSCVAVHVEDKEVPISVHGTKRKSEACLETISSYPTTVDLSTSMQTEKSSLSENEHMFFEFGIEAGLMLLLSSRHTINHQLHQSLKKSVDMVADLRHKLGSNTYLLPQHQMGEKPWTTGTLRKQRRLSQISDSKLENICTTSLRNQVDDCEVGDEDSISEASVLTVDHTPQEGNMTELEKELEAELELMELNFNGGNPNDNQERLSGLSNLDSDGVGGVLHQIQTPNDLWQSPGPNDSNIDLCKHVVSPSSLDNVLKGAKENRGARIIELEARVSEAKKLLQSREREILWWKDCASYLIKQQFVPITEELAAAIENIGTKQVPDKNCLSPELSDPELDRPLLKPFAPEKAFPCGIKSFNFQSENSNRDGMDYTGTTRRVNTSESIPTFQGAVDLALGHGNNGLLEVWGAIKDQNLNKGDVCPYPNTHGCKDGDMITASEDCTSKICNEDSDYDSDCSCISSCSSLFCTETSISLKTCT